MKLKPLYKTSINPNTKDEWMIKEEGSWEDHGKPATGHIYSLLQAMPKNAIVCNTQEELSLVSRSADYQTHWNSDEPDVIKLERKCAKICKEVNAIN